jgi:hypothetical protein
MNVDGLTKAQRTERQLTERQRTERQRTERQRTERQRTERQRTERRHAECRAIVDDRCGHNTRGDGGQSSWAHDSAKVQAADQPGGFLRHANQGRLAHDNRGRRRGWCKRQRGSGRW